MTAARPRRAVSSAAGFLALGGAIALLAPVLPLADPADVDLRARYAAWSWTHPFGTDSDGRDVLSRLVWGARSSLVGPTVVVVLAVVLGVGVSVLAAWRGGRLDAVVARSLDVGLAFPGLLVALVATSLFGRGLAAASVALAIAYVPSIGRLTRSVALEHVRAPYVDALRVQGHSAWSICVFHVVPNLGRMIAAQAAVVFGSALVDLAALSYLGLGAEENTPDWGGMVAAGQRELLEGHPAQVMVAGAVVVCTVVAVNLFGDRFSERRLQRRIPW